MNYDDAIIATGAGGAQGDLVFNPHLHLHQQQQTIFHPLPAQDGVVFPPISPFPIQPPHTAVVTQTWPPTQHPPPPHTSTTSYFPKQKFRPEHQSSLSIQTQTPFEYTNSTLIAETPTPTQSTYRPLTTYPAKAEPYRRTTIAHFPISMKHQQQPPFSKPIPTSTTTSEASAPSPPTSAPTPTPTPSTTSSTTTDTSATQPPNPIKTKTKSRRMTLPPHIPPPPALPPKSGKGRMVVHYPGISCGGGGGSPGPASAPSPGGAKEKEKDASASKKNKGLKALSVSASGVDGNANGGGDGVVEAAGVGAGVLKKKSGKAGKRRPSALMNLKLVPAPAQGQVAASLPEVSMDGATPTATTCPIPTLSIPIPNTTNAIAHSLHHPKRTVSQPQPLPENTTQWNLPFTQSTMPIPIPIPQQPRMELGNRPFPKPTSAAAGVQQTQSVIHPRVLDLGMPQGQGQEQCGGEMGYGYGYGFRQDDGMGVNGEMDMDMGAGVGMSYMSGLEIDMGQTTAEPMDGIHYGANNQQQQQQSRTPFAVSVYPTNAKPLRRSSAPTLSHSPSVATQLQHQQQQQAATPTHTPTPFNTHNPNQQQHTWPRMPRPQLHHLQTAATMPLMTTVPMEQVAAPPRTAAAPITLSPIKDRDEVDSETQKRLPSLRDGVVIPVSYKEVVTATQAEDQMQVQVEDGSMGLETEPSFQQGFLPTSAETPVADLSGVAVMQMAAVACPPSMMEQDQDTEMEDLVGVAELQGQEALAPEINMESESKVREWLISGEFAAQTACQPVVMALAMDPRFAQQQQYAVPSPQPTVVAGAMAYQNGLYPTPEASTRYTSLQAYPHASMAKSNFAIPVYAPLGPQPAHVSRRDADVAAVNIADLPESITPLRPPKRASAIRRHSHSISSAVFGMTPVSDEQSAGGKVGVPKAKKPPKRRHSEASALSCGSIGSGSLWPDTTKPDLTISTLCKVVLGSSPRRKLTLSQLYESITERFPFYSLPEAGSWRSSVRHTLSQQKCFVKEARSPEDPGQGQYWMMRTTFD